uniref:Uncharacterized protein n=2 Tax=viral metagenome TaxID=1070528 RepID=A0A6M3IFM6_9ZZZZ
MAHYWLPDATSGTGTGNWSATGATGHWADDAIGTNLGKAAPGAGESTIFTNGFNGAGQVVTVDATAYCLDMDWTGATNTPTLAFGNKTLNTYGNITFIAAMAITSTTGNISTWTNACALTTNGLTVSVSVIVSSPVTLQDNYTGKDLQLYANTLGTNNVTVSLTGANGVYLATAGAKTLTMGASIINCASWTYSGSNLTVTANTATINVTGTGAVALGTANWAGADFNLNGTAHTVSGSPTGIAVFTRNGTATKTDTITLTSGATLTCTTFAMIGNSRTNQLNVITTTLGSPATITATNWTGTNNADLMDITATNAVDFSAGGLNILTIGDGGGNTGITFPAAANQASTKNGSASDSTMWTSRIPLVGIDDVTVSHDLTYDMPRIGKSITFTGTPTVTLSNNISNYGSLTLASGMTYNASTYINFFRGRGAYTLTCAGKSLYNISVYMVGGTLTLQDDITATAYLWVYNGTLDLNDKDSTAGICISDGTATRSILLGNGTITINRTSAGSKWNFGTTTGLTFDAEDSTIIMTNSGTNAQTFSGGGLTYNHVRVEGAGAYTLTITGDNTFEKLRQDNIEAIKTIRVTPGSVQTIRNLQVFSNKIKEGVIDTGGAAATIQGHRGYCELNHVNLTSIVAGEKYKYYAGNNSTDGTGNTNWIFTHKARAVD